MRTISPKYFIKHELARILYLKNTQRSKEAVQVIFSLENSNFLLRNDSLNSSFQTLKGITLYEQNRNTEAKDSYIKALALYRKNEDWSGVKGSLINIGSTFFQEEKYDSAEFYFLKALTEDSSHLYGFEKNLKINLAAVYQNTKRNKESLKIYFELLNNKPMCNPAELTYLYFNTSCIFLNLSKADSALMFIRKADYNFTLGLSSVKQSKIYENYAKSFSKIGINDSAYYYSQLADSISAIEDQSGTNLLVERLNFEHQKDLSEAKKELLEEQNAYEKSTKRSLQIFIAILLLLFTAIIGLMINKRKKKRILFKKNKQLIEIQKDSKTVNKSNTSNELIEKLEIFLSEKTVYKDPNMSLDKLAKKLKTNRTYLSESINDFYQSSYSNLIKSRRIIAAQQMLIDPSFSNYSIEGIAQSVGFKSLSTFNSSFKNETGITPSYFRKNVSKKS